MPRAVGNDALNVVTGMLSSAAAILTRRSASAIALWRFSRRVLSRTFEFDLMSVSVSSPARAFFSSSSYIALVFDYYFLPM